VKILPRAALAMMLGLCMMVGGTAFGVPSFPVDPETGLGGVLAQFMNKTAFFSGSNMVVAPNQLVGGEEGRSVLYASNFYENALPGLDNAPDAFPGFWTPSGSGEEITALVYNFTIPGSLAGGKGQIVELGAGGYVATGVTSGIMPAGYIYLIGGKVDVYLDTTPDFAYGSPGLWVPDGIAPGIDDFPTVTDTGDAGATLWMTGSAVPLISDIGAGTTQELMPGELPLAYWDPSGDTTTSGFSITDPSGDDVPVTEIVTDYDPLTGGGTSHGWFDVTGGSLFPIVAQDILDPLGVSSFDYDLYFESDVLPDTGPWPANSSDPVVFAVVPEPSSMLVFGLGSVMFAAIAAHRKRHRKL